MPGNDFGDATTNLSAYQVLKRSDDTTVTNDSIVSDLLFSLISNNDVALANSSQLLTDSYASITLPPVSGQTVGTSTTIDKVMLIRKQDTTFNSTTTGFVLTTDLSSNTTNLVQPVIGYYKSRTTDASMSTIVSIDGSSTPYVLSTVAVDVINNNVDFEPRNTINDSNRYFKLHINETDDPTYTLAKVVFGQGNTTSTTKSTADSKMNISFDNTLNAGALNLAAYNLTELDASTNTITRVLSTFDTNITLNTNSSALQTQLSGASVNNFGIYQFDISNNTVDVSNNDTGYTNTTSRYAVSIVDFSNNYSSLPTSVTTASFESWFNGASNVKDYSFISVTKTAPGAGYSLTTPSDASYISIMDYQETSSYNDYMYTLADQSHFIDISSNALTFTSLDASSNNSNNVLFTASLLGETLSDTDASLNGEIRISVDASNARTADIGTPSGSFSTKYIAYASDNSNNSISNTLKTTRDVSYNIYNVIPPQGSNTIYDSSTNFVKAASGAATLYSNGANSGTDSLLVAADSTLIIGDLSGCEAFYANITASRLLINTATDSLYNSYLMNVSDNSANIQSSVYAEALGYTANFFNTYKDYRFFVQPKTTLVDLSLNSAYGSWGLSKRNSDGFLKATQPSTKATNYFPRMADIRKVCNADSSLNITFKYATEPWVNNINDSADTLTVEYSLDGSLNSYVALTEADMSYNNISSSTSYENVTSTSTIAGPLSKDTYTFVKMTIVETYNVVAPFNLGGITNIDLTINNVQSTNTSYLLFLRSDNISTTDSNLHTKALPRSILQGWTINGIDMSLVNEIITSGETQKTITVYKKALTPLIAGLYGTNGNITSSNIYDWTSVVTKMFDIDPFSGTVAIMDLSDNLTPSGNYLLNVQNITQGTVKFSLTPRNVSTLMNNINKMTLTEASGYYVNISSHLLTSTENYVVTARKYDTIDQLGSIFGTGHNNLNIFDSTIHTGPSYSPTLTVTKTSSNETFTLKTTTGQTIMSYTRSLDVINEIQFFFMRKTGLFWTQRTLNGAPDTPKYVAGSISPTQGSSYNINVETGVDVLFTKSSMANQDSVAFSLNTDILEVKNVKQSGSTYSNTRLSTRSNLSFTDPSAETITVPWWRGYYYNTGKTTSVHTINRSRMTCSVIIGSSSSTSIGPIFYNAALQLKAKNSVTPFNYNVIPAQITSKWSLLPAAALTNRVKRIPITLVTDTISVTINDGSNNLVSTPYTHVLAKFDQVFPNSNFKIRASTIHYQDAAPSGDIWKATYKISPIYVSYTSSYTLKGAATLNTVNWGAPKFTISNTLAKQGIWFNNSGCVTTESDPYPFKLSIPPTAPTPGKSYATCYPPYLKAFTPQFNAAGSPGSPSLSSFDNSRCITRWSPILKQSSQEQITPFTSGESGFSGSCFVPNYYLTLQSTTLLTSYIAPKVNIYFTGFSSTVKITETYNTNSAANNVTNSVYVPIEDLTNYNKNWQQDAATILTRTFGINFELLTQALHTTTNMAVKFNNVIVPTKTYSLYITTSEQLNAKIYYYKYSSLTSDKSKLNLDIYKAEFAYSLNIPGVNLKMLQQIKLENPLSFKRITIPFYYTDLVSTTNGFNIINFQKLIATEFSTVSTIKTPITNAGWADVTDSSFGWVCINALNATGQAALIDFVAVDNFYKNSFVRISTPLIHKSTSSDGRYLSALNYYGEYSAQSINTNLIKLNITDSSTTDYSTTDSVTDTSPTNDNLSLLTQANISVEFR